MKGVTTHIDEFINRLDKAAGTGHLSVFCGAGISLASGIPTVLPLVRKLLEMLDCHPNDIEIFLKNGELPIPFESIIQEFKGHLVFSNGHNFLTEFAKLFYAKPNATHFLLAKLLHQGLIKNIFTTNFDTCVERAYAILTGEKLPKIIVYSESDAALTKAELDGKIVKVHGCVTKPSSLGTTVDQITKNEFFIKNRIIVDMMLRSSTDILFLGYSCSDKWDITRIFNELNNRNKSKVRLLFWQHFDAAITKPTILQERLFDGYKYFWATDHTNTLIEKLSSRYNVTVPDFNFTPPHYLSSSLEPLHSSYVLGKLMQAANMNTHAADYLKASIPTFSMIDISMEVIDAKESLADISRKINKPNEPENLYRQSLELLESCKALKMRTRNFVSARLYRKLGIYLVVEGRADEGRQLVKQAVEKVSRYKLARLTMEQSFEVAEVYNDNGYILYELKQFDEAEHFWLLALNVQQNLAAIFPQRYTSAYCVSLNNLSAKYYMASQYDKAIEYGKKCLNLTVELAAINPAYYNGDLGRRLNNLGCYYRDAGDRRSALRYLKKALRLRQQLAKTAPEAYLPQVAYTFLNLGVVYQIEPQNKEMSIEFIDKAISILKEFKNVQAVYKYLDNVAKVLKKWSIDPVSYFESKW